MAEPEYKYKFKSKVNFWAFRWGALKGTPPARLRRALGIAEPVYEALRLRLGLQILPASLTLRQAPSVLANATSKEFNNVEGQLWGRCQIF